MLAAPTAVFLKLQFAFNRLLVLASPVIYFFANRALHFYQIFLGHVPSLRHV